MTTNEGNPMTTQNLTPAEHYRKAEECMDAARDAFMDRKGEMAERLMRQAQIHATLATARNPVVAHIIVSPPTGTGEDDSSARRLADAMRTAISIQEEPRS